MVQRETLGPGGNNQAAGGPGFLPGAADQSGGLSPFRGSTGQTVDLDAPRFPALTDHGGEIAQGILSEKRPLRQDDPPPFLTVDGLPDDGSLAAQLSGFAHSHFLPSTRSTR